MRLGRRNRKILGWRTLAVVASGAALFSVVGCEGQVAGVVVDALNSALQTAIPALMDLLKADVINAGDGSTTTPGSLPTVMNEVIRTAGFLLA
jgi:hypothetical protein